MTVDVTVTWPAGPFLFGDDVAGRLHDALVDPQRWPEIEARLGAVGVRLLGLVHSELASAAAQFTDVDLAAVLKQGWETHRELRAAGRKSLVEGTEVPVVLATHDVTLTQRPAVDVLLDGRRVLTIECEFSAVLTVEGLRVVVRAGALHAVQAGACTLTVSFAVAGVELAKRAYHGQSLLGFGLGAGVPLVASGDRHDGVDQAFSDDGERPLGGT